MKKRSGATDDFWASYTDLMTSLFFVMLVLYVLTYVYLKNQQKATEAQLRKIREIQNASKELDPRYFRYDSAYKRFTLTQAVHFEKGKSDIVSRTDRIYLIDVGSNILSLIKRLKAKDSTRSTSYMVVIEGMASRDNFDRNYQLSYDRALALFRLWQASGLYFDPSVCEVQVAGSGTGGVGRDAVESLNQRFLIQIVPKLGEIK